MDEAVEAGLVEAHVLEELVALGGVELGDLGLHLAADADDLGVLFGGALLYGGYPLVAFSEAGVVDVGDVEHGLGGDEEEVAGVGPLFFGEVYGAGGLAGFEEKLA